MKFLLVTQFQEGPKMQHTPYGDSVMFTGAPVHAGFSGGDVVKVSPAKLQLTGHAVAVIVYGDRPQSKMGEGS